jgi:UDP-GlcNAc3NAcA epimerase
MILSELGLKQKSYCLATVHREENTANGKRLTGIFKAFKRLATQACPFIAPLHPRTAKALNELGGDRFCGPHLRILEPVSYLDMVLLETHAKVILTDSGGVRKEAYFAQTPCITLRDETEWVKLISHKCNLLAGTSEEHIFLSFKKMTNSKTDFNVNLYGNGEASEMIVDTFKGEFVKLN